MHHSRILVTAVSLLVQCGLSGAALAAPEPSTLFKTKCSSCHTFGKGDHIGPDLKGVTQRHPRPWLIAWIRSSETQIRRRDAVALELFRKYGQQRMPDHDLSDAQIAALLDYFDAGGPAADEPHRLRAAADATAQDVELGRRLFLGEVRFAGGAAACVLCHSVSRQTRLGGSLAPDLGEAYPRYLDWALDQRLRHPCLPGAADLAVPRVAESESFALRAFFRAIGRGPATAGRASDGGSGGVRTSASR
jgi:mono/diheme cytochrome c family protein